jgi:Putative peptidoglycan binding domain
MIVVFSLETPVRSSEDIVPNGQQGARGWAIGTIAAVVVIAVIGWAWNYAGYGWGTWWNQNTSNHAADMRSASSGSGAASNMAQQPQNEQQSQQSQTQQQLAEQSEAQHPNNQRSQPSNANQPPQNQSSTNQAAQKPSNANQPSQNQSSTNQAAQEPSNANQPPQNQSTNQAAQEPSNANGATQNQSSKNEPAQNQPNNEQFISANSLSRIEIQQIQQALNASGFRAGPADGRWGPKTSDALKHFQQSKDMKATGQPDQQTLSALGVNAAAQAVPRHAGARARHPARGQRLCGPTGTCR